MPTHPKFCTATYGLSAILDVADGMAARALNQTSRFGANLGNLIYFTILSSSLAQLVLLRLELELMS